MTQHVRVGYRRHRKATWGLALFLVAAIAAIAIPFATGAPAKELRFVDQNQPDNFWQKNTLNSVPVGVAVYSGQTIVNQGGTPTIAVAAGSAGTTSDFDFGSPVKTNNVWTWPNAKPKSDADSGLYTFVATLGSLTATSHQFRVSDFVCPASGGPGCNGTSNPGPGQGKFNISNSQGSTIALDFGPGGTGTQCNPWTPASFGNPPVYFPAVTLTFNGNTGNMLQVTYLVKNSEWVLTDAARGNNDPEFCTFAHHNDSLLNDGNFPFAGKYPQIPASGTPTSGVLWNGTDYYGVIGSVSNPSQVGSDPVVCGRGNQVISGVTWRAWTICIPQGPTGWDWGTKPS